MSAPIDTIAAIATAPGRGAVGVLRLSGPRAAVIGAAIGGSLPPPRQAMLRRFRNFSGDTLDQGLALYFPAPQSYTGEDVVELQGHGGPVVLDLLLRAACAHGARLARPGEFSERAFLNGRLDLAQAEAIADLIAATSAQAARAAQRSLEGELSRRVNALVEELTQLRVFVEGALDFSDEEVDWLSDRQLHSRLDTLLENLRLLLLQATQGRRLREGMSIALGGQPNVGKSTLLNRLSGTDAAIVTDIAGTTRDLLRENIALDGLPLTVIDTAGLRDSEDPVEREGVRRAWQALESAELALFLVDDRVGLSDMDVQLLARFAPGTRRLIVRNKCDLSARAPEVFEEHGGISVRISAASGAGIELLAQQIKQAAGLENGAQEGLFSARARHLEALQTSLNHAGLAQQSLQRRAAPELAAEELRLAQRALSEITGAFSSDALLGRIFSAFCIGK